MTIFLALALLPFVYGFTHEGDCSPAHYMQCTSELMTFGQGKADLIFTSVEELQADCELRKNAINCTKHFIRNCLKPEEKQMYQTLTGGKQMLVEEICTPGSDLSRRYVKSVECFKKIINDTNTCHDKFKTSEHRINEEVNVERTKVFYSCCSFDWYRQCKMEAASEHCGRETAELLDYMARTEGGIVLSKMCDEIFPDCYGRLYGFEHETSSAPGRRYEFTFLILLPSVLFYCLKYLSM